MNRRHGAFVLGTILLVLLVAIASNAEQFDEFESRAPATRTILPIEKDLAEALDREPIRQQEPIDIPQPVVIAFAAAAGIGVLYLLSRQQFSLRFRRPSVQITRGTATVTEEETADAIASLATDLIQELNESDSPRVAIQRAYAAVESGFGAQELARKPAETPLRYLDRIFGRHKTLEEPLAQLTALFQRARFSEEPVDESMRSDAIESLTTIRDYYKAFAWKKISSRRAKATA